jgi:uncharacterized membrane protein
MTENNVIYLFTCILIPLLLFLISAAWIRFPIKKMNYFVGYRTPRSRSGPEAWKEANRFAPRLTLVLSGGLLAIASLLWFFFSSKIELTILIWINLGLLVISVVMIIVLTELRLKKMFGK